MHCSCALLLTGYHAPEHRVLTNPLKPRYSAPFFYNPAYAAAVAPLPSLGAALFDPYPLSFLCFLCHKVQTVSMGGVR